MHAALISEHTAALPAPCGSLSWKPLSAGLNTTSAIPIPLRRLSASQQHMGIRLHVIIVLQTVISVSRLPSLTSSCK